MLSVISKGLKTKFFSKSLFWSTSYCVSEVRFALDTFTAWKVSKYGVISGPYFPVFSPNTGKYGPEITRYLDTFHTVFLFCFERSYGVNDCKKYVYYQSRLSLIADFIFCYQGFCSLSNQQSQDSRGRGRLTVTALPPASQMFRNWPGDYCRDSTPAQHRLDTKCEVNP